MNDKGESERDRADHGSEAEDELAVTKRRLADAERELARRERLLEASGRRLRETEDKLNAVFDASPEAIFTLTIDGRVTGWNAVAENVFGWRLDEVVGKPLPIVPPEKEAEFASLLGQVVGGSSFSGVELERIRRDGSRFTMSLSAAPIRDERGTVAGIMAIAVDLTDRKIIETFLRMSEERFRLAFDNASIGRALTMADGRFGRVNKALCEMLGYSAEDLQARTFASVTHPDDLAASGECVRCLLAKERDTYRFEKRYIRGDGRVVWAEVSTTLLRGEDGDPISFISDVMDVTEKKRAEEALKAEKDWTSALISDAPTIVIAMDERNRIKLFNQYAEKCTGYSAREVLGREWIEVFVPEERRPEIWAVWYGILETEPTQHRYENPVVTKSGDLRLIFWSNCIVRNSEGARTILSIGEDVTERKAIEGALACRRRELEGLYRCARAVLSGDSFDAIARLVFDEARSTTGARCGYVALLNDTSRENELLFLEAGGLSCEVDPTLPMPIRGLREISYESGRAVYENDFMNSGWAALMPKGHVDLVNVLFAPLVVDGKAAGVIGLANKPSDFNEDDAATVAAMGQLAAFGLQRCRIESLLRAERDSFSAVMQTAPVAILIADAAENVIHMNKAARETFSCDDEAPSGPLRCGPIFGCIHCRRVSALCGIQEACPNCRAYGVIKEGLAGRTVNDVAAEIASESGGKVIRRQILLSAAPVVYSGRPCVIVAIKDITELRDLHARIAQADRLSTIGMLAAGVAHEINNPLSYVLYNLETLSAELQGPIAARDGKMERESARNARAAHSMQEEMLDQFNDALTGAQRIRDIVRNLGTFSRVEKERIVPVDIRSVMDVVSNMAFNEIKHRARLVKDYGAVLAVSASEGRLSQVFLNLIINAAHSIDEGRVDENEIRLRTWSEGQEVFAEIRDTGHGIDAETKDKVFEPFFTTKGEGKGTGLGLAISRNIIEGYGGDISVESEIGKGTSFVVRLPTRRMGHIEHEEVAPSANAEGHIRGRILIVDDEKKVCAATARMLAHHETVQVIGGLRAREMLENDRSFDVIVCDVMMPDFSGVDLHTWLLEFDPRLARRLVFITGGAFTPRAKSYLQGVDNPCLEKPFRATDIRKLVGDRLEAARRER